MNFEETINVAPRQLAPKVFVVCNGTVREFVLNHTAIFGRITESGSPDIGVDMRYVSRRHGSFEMVSGRFSTGISTVRTAPGTPTESLSRIILRS